MLLENYRINIQAKVKYYSYVHMQLLTINCTLELFYYYIE